MEDDQEKMSAGYKGNYLFSSMLDSGFYSLTTIFQAILVFCDFFYLPFVEEKWSLMTNLSSIIV